MGILRAVGATKSKCSCTFWNLAFPRIFGAHLPLTIKSPSNSPKQAFKLNQKLELNIFQMVVSVWTDGFLHPKQRRLRIMKIMNHIDYFLRESPVVWIVDLIYTFLECSLVEIKRLTDWLIEIILASSGWGFRKVIGAHINPTYHFQIWRVDLEAGYSMWKISGGLYSTWG